MENNPTHIPKGEMCLGCKHLMRKCNHLNFEEMQPIGKYKECGTTVVRCVDYTKEPDNRST